MIKNIVVAGLFGAIVATSAQANIAYTSPDFSNAANPVTNAWCSSCGSSYSVSDVFTLGANGTLTGVDFAVQSSYGSNWNIQLGVWDMSLSTQYFGITLAPADYSIAQLGNDVAMISASFAGPSLAAGSYRMSWYDPVNLGVPGYALGTSLIQTQGSTHNGLEQGAAFQVYSMTAAVPEPETYALMLAGLVAVGAVVRRRSATARV